jgi:flavodoxin
MPQQRTLVVYYSRSGTTRKVAEALAEMLGGDVDEIVEIRGRSGMFGYLRSLVEARRQISSPIGPEKRDPSAYDLVIVGTPVWAWSVSSPVRAYLMATRERLPNAAFFCTLGGAGDARAFAQMQSIASRVPRAVCAIAARDVASGRYRERLAEFARALEPLAGVKPAAA